MCAGVWPLVGKGGPYRIHTGNTTATSIDTPIVISDITIRQDSEGHYCLNDLHEASGGAAKDRPNYWLHNIKTQELIRELENQAAGFPAPYDTPVNTVIGKGKEQGTYVCKELVYAYAMWVSPAFHLKVIRAYDRLATQGVAVHENAAAAVGHQG